MDLGNTLSTIGIQPTLSTVYYFENVEHGDNPQPHYHIAVPTTNGDFILLVMFTSQVDRKIEYYTLANNKALESLVHAKENDFYFLTKDSVIDCNQPIFKTREELSSIIKNIEYREADLTDEIIDKIKEAINKSPIVRRNVKNAIKN